VARCHLAAHVGPPATSADVPIVTRSLYLPGGNVKSLAIERVYGCRVPSLTRGSPNTPDAGDRAELLAAAAESMRAIFHAKAASVLLAEQATKELVFGGVAGEGGEVLHGRRIPIDTGIAGAVLASGEPVAVDDVRADPRFAASVAEASGYMPTQLMAAPLLHGTRKLGVVEVFDRPQFSRFSLVELDMLTLLARQLAIGVYLFGEAIGHGRSDPQAKRLERVAAQLEAADNRQRDAAEALITELEQLLA
jgi:signal transduction protein with GAF and PtsI domain